MDRSGGWSRDTWSKDTWSKDTWSKATWNWSPADGRWSAERHGLPRSAVRLSLDTDTLRAHERYDFWREVALYDLDADSRPDTGAFRGAASGIIGPSGSVFVNTAEALSGTRRRGQSERDGCDTLAIGLVVQGKRGHEEGDERNLTTAGQFLVFDTRRASRLIWTSYATVHLVLKRPRVEAILGGAVPSSASLARRLAAAPAGRVLAAHLRALGAEIDHLGPEAWAGALGITLDLAHLALRDIANRRWTGDGEDDDAVSGGIFLAALRVRPGTHDARAMRRIRTMAAAA